MNRYKNTGARPLYDAKPGEEFDQELTVEEEATLLAQGRLEILPRPYRVIGAREVAGNKPGEDFLGVFRLDHEAALIDGGHIERRPRVTKQATAKAVVTDPAINTKE